MKNIKITTLISAFLMLMTLGSCSNEAPISSRITTYAVFDYEPLSAVALGTPFTPSATANEGGQEIPVTVVGSVDTSTVGIYTITYSATNADGFDATAVQTVVVHDPAIIGTDVSGNVWDKNNHTRTSKISLVPGTTSIFYATDFGFSGLFPIYFQMNGNTISDIPQTYPLDQESVALGYDPISREFTNTIQPAGFSYTFEYF